VNVRDELEKNQFLLRRQTIGTGRRTVAVGGGRCGVVVMGRCKWSRVSTERWQGSVADLQGDALCSIITGRDQATIARGCNAPPPAAAAAAAANYCRRQLLGRCDQCSLRREIAAESLHVRLSLPATLKPTVTSINQSRTL